jgi:hypothetical protein
MSSSCSGSACETSKGEVVADICAECGEKGTTVDPITLKALLAAEGLRRGVPPHPRFCAGANCPVVYFDRGVVFREADLVVRVHAKHPDDDDVPICYCFRITPATLERQIAIGGRSTARDEIAALVRAGRCACEVKNPKGTCCLGDLARAEQQRSGVSAVGR